MACSCRVVDGRMKATDGFTHCTLVREPQPRCGETSSAGKLLHPATAGHLRAAVSRRGRGGSDMGQPSKVIYRPADEPSGGVAGGLPQVGQQNTNRHSGAPSMHNEPATRVSGRREGTPGCAVHVLLSVFVLPMTTTTTLIGLFTTTKFSNWIVGLGPQTIGIRERQKMYAARRFTFTLYVPLVVARTCPASNSVL
ncbi:hypothetical protein C8Q72DRAFT_216263 [Fomitopsis betulina]|nr:hypothetical protein C8Q72DRAFT_216263 [Fomitopsis betulina]